MRKLSREQIIIIIFSFFVFLIGGFIIISENRSNSQIIASLSASSPFKNGNIMELENTEKGAENGEDKVDYEKQVEEEWIIVHVAGEVINPGVYELIENSRVIDAVELAGGATTNADLDIINLAAFISDGQQIYVPSDEESASIINNNTTYISDSNNSSGKVNINTAGLIDLQNLSGIGPGKAQSIIEYRNKNGPFLTPADLLNVSGIGEKTFEKIKDKIIIK